MAIKKMLLGHGELFPQVKVFKGKDYTGWRASSTSLVVIYGWEENTHPNVTQVIKSIVVFPLEYPKTEIDLNNLEWLRNQHPELWDNKNLKALKKYSVKSEYGLN